MEDIDYLHYNVFQRSLYNLVEKQNFYLTEVFGQYTKSSFKFPQRTIKKFITIATFQM